MFRTCVKIPAPSFSIDHHTKITCIGSCFAEHIGDRLALSAMNILCNPTGIMYNPVSLSDGIRRAINRVETKEQELFLQQGRWVHYDYHSSLSSTIKSETLTQIDHSNQMFHQQLISSDVLILSLGTAFVFKLIEENRIINNCHKMPNHLFERSILSLDQVKLALDKTLNTLWRQNPAMRIIMTISPIRHIRDGLIANQRSKATLHLAVQELSTKYSSVYYFPSYEILLDDLRDYRFYDRDMIHPSTVAIDYIWEQFSNVFFDKGTMQLIKKIVEIKTAMSHRPFNPRSEQHIKFRKNQHEKINFLIKEYPFLSMKKALNFFNDDKNK